MALHFILAAALLVAASGPVLAQDSAKPEPQVQAQEFAHEKLSLQIPESILRGEAAYAAALQQLTDEQKSQLITLDRAFYVTMVPILETYDIGGKLIFCLGANQEGSAISGSNPQYVQSFRAYQAEKIAEQKALWREHASAAREVKSLEHALMDAHYRYIEAVQKSAAEQMVNQMGRGGGYLDTNCREVQKMLDVSASRVQKAAPEATPAAPAAPIPSHPPFSATPANPVH